MCVLRLPADPAAAIAASRGWLAQAQPPPLVVETSGSTGRPKRVLLGRPAVLASARATAEVIGEGRWALALPPDYIAGAQVIVRSLLAGSEPAVVGQGGVAAAYDEGARFVSLVATQLHRLLADGESRSALASYTAVLLGGGPADPALLERARAAGVPVITTYGASETAGGCVYDGRPLPGVEVSVDAEGRIWLGGPTIFGGYLDDPEATAAALVDGRFRTSDAGLVGADGRLRVLGRFDDMVITGGVKVPGPAVAARLRAHPGVEAAEVLGVRDEEWGRRVVAFVQGSLSLAEARDWVAAEHPRTWAPRQLVAVAEWPVLANGKLDRRALEALA